MRVGRSIESALGVVPAFTPAARCGPRMLSQEGQPLHWGRRVIRIYFPPPPVMPQVQVPRVREFLSMGSLPDGRLVAILVDEPEECGDGWFPLRGTGLGEGRRSGKGRGTAVRWKLYTPSWWTKALRPSQDATQGEGFFKEAPGIYVHCDTTAQKADNYMRYVPLCQDGVFWAVKWEARVDRSSRVTVSSRYGTDQSVRHPQSVVLVALWVKRSTHGTRQESSDVQAKWDPTMQASPFEKSERTEDEEPPLETTDNMRANHE